MQTIPTRGGSVVAESIGRPEDPPILLVAGTSHPMDFWRPGFCDQLAAAGLRVIRYDQRDTGQASADPPGAPTYGLPDLVADAITVLDALGIDAAHWAGFSQGGWVSQLAAIHHPARVRSTTLLATRPVGHGDNDPDLPEMTTALADEFTADTGPASESAPDWVRYLVAWDRRFASPAAPFDETAATALAQDVVDRTRDMWAAATNHPTAPQGPRWRHLLPQVTAPTAVVHGDHDPLFPLGNGRALAAAIPGARLEVLPDTGHELPARHWARVVDAIVRNANATGDVAS